MRFSGCYTNVKIINATLSSSNIPRQADLQERNSYAAHILNQFSSNLIHLIEYPKATSQSMPVNSS